MNEYQGPLKTKCWKLVRKRPDGSTGEFVWLPNRNTQPGGFVRFTTARQARDFLEYQQNQPGGGGQTTVEPDRSLVEVVRKWRMRLQQTPNGTGGRWALYVNPEIDPETERVTAEYIELVDDGEATP